MVLEPKGHAGFAVRKSVLQNPTRRGISLRQPSAFLRPENMPYASSPPIVNTKASLKKLFINGETPLLMLLECCQQLALHDEVEIIAASLEMTRPENSYYTRRMMAAAELFGPVSER